MVSLPHEASATRHARLLPLAPDCQWRSGSTEAAIYAFRETFANIHRDPVRVAIIIRARNAFNEVDHQRILDEVTVHAPGIARYLHIVYGSAPFPVACRRMIQGTQQGNPLRIFLFSLVL